MSNFAFTDHRPIEDWREVADTEGHMAMGKPNPYAAARAYSEKGKPTAVWRDTYSREHGKVVRKGTFYDKGVVVKSEKYDNGKKI